MAPSFCCSLYLHPLLYDLHIFPSRGGVYSYNSWTGLSLWLVLAKGMPQKSVSIQEALNNNTCFLEKLPSLWDRAQTTWNKAEKSSCSNGGPRYVRESNYEQQGDCQTCSEWATASPLRSAAPSNGPKDSWGKKWSVKFWGGLLQGSN